MQTKKSQPKSKREAADVTRRTPNTPPASHKAASAKASAKKTRPQAAASAAIAVLESPDHRLTPDEFRAIIRARGWTIRTLARRWGKGENWISKIASDAEREQHWDDAVRGVPPAPRGSRLWTTP